jgi:flagellar protein FlbD
MNTEERGPHSKARLSGKRRMIQLTRLNNSPLIVNSDLVKFVEQSPDTVITLVNGEKLLVREKADEVLSRIVEFRRSVLQGIVLFTNNVPAMDSAAEHEEAPATQQAER